MRLSIIKWACLVALTACDPSLFAYAGDFARAPGDSDLPTVDIAGAVGIEGGQASPVLTLDAMSPYGVLVNWQTVAGSAEEDV